jgi:hypothetical protein
MKRKTYRIHVEVSEEAYYRLIAELDRRTRLDGRGKLYPQWRIIEELLMTLPDRPEPAHKKQTVPNDAP